jgi:hypothetical protein
LTVAQVNAAIGELQRQQATITAELAATANTLAEQDAKVGAEFLAGNETFVDGLTPLRNRFDAMNRAVEVINARLASAQVDLTRAEIEEKRQQAADKRAEIAAIEAKVRPLLAKLEEIEGVQYGLGILSCEPAKNAFLAAPEYLGWSERPANIAFIGIPFACPRSRALRNEAELLEKEAIHLEVKLNAPKPRLPRTDPTRHHQTTDDVIEVVTA